MNIFFLAMEISFRTIALMYAGLLLVAVIYFFIRAALREREHRRRNAKYLQP